MTEDLQHERIDLAAAFRLAERFNFHEAVANHFSDLKIILDRDDPDYRL